MWPRGGELPDVEALADQVAALDLSVVNGSSIAFLAEFSGDGVLVGSDAFAQDLTEAIRRFLRERALERLPLAAFVVPGAGSRRRITVELLELLDCATYLFSTDGSRFRKPDPEAVAAILRYARPTPDTSLTLVFNHHPEWNAVWQSPELQSRHGYRAIYPAPGSAGIRVDLGGRAGEVSKTAS